MVDQMHDFELSPPLDLSHHYSDVTKHRLPSAIKGFYKYFAIPGIGNLAGGMFNNGILVDKQSLICIRRPS